MNGESTYDNGEEEVVVLLLLTDLRSCSLQGMDCSAAWAVTSRETTPPPLSIVATATAIPTAPLSIDILVGCASESSTDPGDI
mmetsp:Transcript_48987/g.56429  ORF Transcript_48987/g.56429 Transcript_48987/m.56429 type:complete len:83 (+) Transcript_48987:119-367(+)